MIRPMRPTLPRKVSLLIVWCLSSASAAMPAPPWNSRAPSQAAPYGEPQAVASDPQEPAPAAQNNPLVWVNTDTGVYHHQGTRYYGKTKHGKYMLEDDARKAGYRPAEKK